MSGLRTTNIFSFLFHAQRSLSKNISHQIILSSSILDRTTTTTRHKKPLRARPTLERRAAARSTVWNEKVAKKKNFKIATDVYDAVTVTCHPRHTRTIRLSVHHSLLSLSSLSLSLSPPVNSLLTSVTVLCLSEQVKSVVLSIFLIYGQINFSSSWQLKKSLRFAGF